ncbi:lipase maturation factor 1-like isoform X2 [Scyliorhinus torazame]|uniref:lipase maturation factor 1-like isoform X2 n=1 Tax=Scyliorhinus torazame TaxID=75743 RepID=UPI003B599C02
MAAAELRCRRVGPAQTGGSRWNDLLSQGTKGGQQEQGSAAGSAAAGGVQVQPGTFWLTRIVLLRSIAFIYFVAFSVGYHQNRQLFGEKGLLPGKLYLQKIQRYAGGRVGFEAFSYAPTILWFLDWPNMDAHLDNIALLGMGLSVFILLTGCANMIIMLILWILYHSLVNIGQICHHQILNQHPGEYC